MVMKKTTLMLIRMITRSKGQYIAVLTIIITGLLVYTSMNTSAINLGTTLDSYYTDNKFADLNAQVVKISEQQLLKLQDLPGVDSVQGRVVFDIPFESEEKDERVNVRIVTVHPENDGINNLTIVDGGFITEEASEVVVLQQFAIARNIKPGDVIELRINGFAYKLNVAGIGASPEYIYATENVQSLIPNPRAFGVIFVSERLGQQAFGYQGSYNDILFTYDESVKEENLIDTLQDDLEPFGMQSITKKEHQLSNSMISEEVKQLERTSNSLPIAFLLIAAVILAMMIGRMVKRDRIKIGILQAIGYSKGRVIRHYAGYSLSAGLIGGFLGSTLGMLLAGFMTSYYMEFFNIPLLKVSFYYKFVIAAVLMTSVFCLIAGLIGAKGILKISPAESMQTEAPRKGKRIFLERFGFFWKRLSFSWKIVFKNIFRNKKRAIFVLFGVTLTYALMLFTMGMPAIIDEFMVKHFTEFQTMDYNVSFRTPMHDRVLKDFGTLVDIDHIEGKIEYPFELQSGSRTKAVPVIGIRQDTEFYTFKDNNDNKVEVPEEGILLSSNLANSLQVDIGDKLKINTYLPGRDDAYVMISGIIKQSMGINAYMNLEHMSELLFEKNAITGVFISTDDPNINEALKKVSNISTVLSPSDLKKVFDQYLGLSMVSIYIMIFFSGLMGFAIVYNATMISVGEREMEFSSLRVLGFSKGEIYRIVLKENNIITVIGILLGIPVGIWMTEASSSVFSTDMYSMSLTPTPLAGVQAAVFTIAFVVLAQIATFRKISTLDFLQALKNRVS